MVEVGYTKSEKMSCKKWGAKIRRKINRQNNGEPD